MTTLQDVTNGANHTGSLRDAILLANQDTTESSTIIFAVSGTIVLHSDLPTIESSVTIAAAQPLTIDGHGHAILDVSNDSDPDFSVTLANLTLTHGVSLGGAGLTMDSGQVTGTGLNIVDNLARSTQNLHASGGGVQVFGGSLTLIDSRVSGNVVRGNSDDVATGGGIDLEGGSLTLSHTIVSGNRAIAANTADGAEGGGIYGQTNTTIIIQDSSLISRNSAAGPLHDSFGNYAAGGGIEADGALVIEFSSVLDNRATGPAGPAAYTYTHGGGIAVGFFTLSGGASLAMTGSQVTGNRSAAGIDGGYASGGGIEVGYLSTMDVSNSFISGNLAKAGNSHLQALDAEGGGIACYGSGSVEASVVKANSAFGGQGLSGPSKGLYASGSDGGGAEGGGIYNDLSSLTIDSTDISGNRAIAGHAGYGQPGAHGRNVSGFLNVGDGDPGQDGGAGGKATGGGVFNCGTMTISNSSIDGNAIQAGAGGNGGMGGHGGTGENAQGKLGSGGTGGAGGAAGDAVGGGIASLTTDPSTPSSLILQNSTVSDNTITAAGAGHSGAGGQPAGSGNAGDHGSVGSAGAAAAPAVTGGAGVYSADMILTVSQSTVAGNGALHSTASSIVEGTGIYINGVAQARIANSTIAGNLVGDGASALAVVPDAMNDSVNVISTIVAQNTLRGATSANVHGTIVTDHDLIGDGAPSAATAPDATSYYGANPMLGPLQYNGGSVATMVPATGSLAIDHGVNPDMLAGDQRDQPRVAGAGIDIGAVEGG